MQKAVIWALVGVLSASAAQAELCALDVAPASTLLLPYYEVDLNRLRKPRRSEVTTVTLSMES